MPKKSKAIKVEPTYCICGTIHGSVYKEILDKIEASGVRKGKPRLSPAEALFFAAMEWVGPEVYERHPLWRI